jgi:uncharacterized protein (DUF1015 family)
MVQIKALKGLCPRKDIADRVISPPYDVLSREEAQIRAAGNPYSFLHINKPEIDCEQDVNPYSSQVYEMGRKNLEKFISENILIQDEKEAIYIYRLQWHKHVQTGYFCLSSVDDYNNGIIKKHEFTRPQKEKDRSELIDAMNAQVGPVFLMYPSDESLDSLLIKLTEQKPEIDIESEQVSHQLWAIKEPADIKAITDAFSRLQATYIADGHHRSAAAANVCAKRRSEHPDYTGEENFNYFLSVLFPHNQLQILPYNRIIKDLNGLSSSQFMARLEENFEVKGPFRTLVINEPQTFGCYLDDHWYHLRCLPEKSKDLDLLSGLDVSILMNLVLQPILGIQDPRTDSRIDFIGGIRGNAELERRVDSGDYRVAFSLYPTHIDTLIKVADKGEIMPPKSTWFEPKLKSGLVTYLL